jgi:hypothetical protein
MQNKVIIMNLLKDKTALYGAARGIGKSRSGVYG